MERKAYPSDVSDAEWALVVSYLTLMTEDEVVTPLVSHILGYVVYQGGNMALTIIKPESQIFTLAADGSISGDANMVGPATAGVWC